MTVAWNPYSPVVPRGAYSTALVVASVLLECQTPPSCYLHAQMRLRMRARRLG